MSDGMPRIKTAAEQAELDAKWANVWALEKAERAQREKAKETPLLYTVDGVLKVKIGESGLL
jgi:hypothetical protein